MSKNNVAHTERAAEEELKLEIEREVRTALAEIDSASARARAMLESVSQDKKLLTMSD